MGKVLVEKLLRSCSGVQCIYVLLRAKRGVQPKQRLNQLINTKIFDNLKQTNPTCLNKIVAIEGDMTLPGLGISDAELNILINNVSIVYHSAATVKFDEQLKDSVEFNVIGTRRVIELCHKIKNLVALVHVSTAYANCNRDNIDEKIYPAPIEPQKLIDTISWMDNDLINQITPKLLGDRPNTYTYTKALAETLLIEECGQLPVAIIRPSIVTAALREPLKGWIDNMNGPTGLVLASGKGLLRTMYYKSSAIADIIPVDSVINLMIAIAWKTATTPHNGVEIYNCTSGSLNPITWGDIEKVCLPNLKKYPSLEVFRYPGGCFKNSWLLNEICVFFDHTIPAYLFDGLCLMTGKKCVMRRIYCRLHKAVDVLKFFTTRQWNFKNHNALKLYNQLNEIDKKTFHFDVRDVDWDKYWESYVNGARKYVLKEDDSSLPLARKNLKRTLVINNLLSILLFMLILFFLFIKLDSVIEISPVIHNVANNMRKVLPIAFNKF